MPRSFSYRACGLSLASDAPIPGLRAISPDGPYDVAISMRGRVAPAHCAERSSLWYVSPERDGLGRPELTIWTGDEGYLLSYSDGASFLIGSDGRSVDAHWVSPSTEADAASYVIRTVLAFVLRLRGAVPVHASAVAIDNRGVLFVGETGTGKSTTAAAFSTLGYPVLSDDIIRIDDVDGQVAAYPSHPRLNVWPDSAAILYGARAGLPVHSETYAKHYLDVLEAGYGFQGTPVPVDAIYVLGERSGAGQSPSIAVMRPGAALMALVRHTYCNYLLDAAMREREFEVLSRLVERVPVRELRFGENLEELVSSCRVLARSGHEKPAGQPS